MRTSVIVSTYNNPRALALCIKSLAMQSLLPAEVIIADDGSGPETRELVDRLRDEYKSLFKMIHVWHEDLGVRKAKIVNDAVRKSSGEYLIFTDGDCLAHKHFVRSHVENSEPDAVLGGRRVEIGKSLTEYLYKTNKIINYPDFRLIWDSMLGNSRKVEEAIQIRSRFLRRLLHRDFITNDGIWGCNYSLYKSLFYTINGCDEDFIDLSLEDNDIGIRVLNLGKRIVSVRGLAIVFHLWHPIRWNFRDERYIHNLKIIKRRIEYKETMCMNGIRKIV